MQIQQHSLRVLQDSRRRSGCATAAALFEGTIGKNSPAAAACPLLVQKSCHPDQRPASPLRANPYEYRYLTEFQSHEPEFDYLKSLEIEEKINKVRWCRRAGGGRSHLLLTTNDKTVKLWKASAGAMGKGRRVCLPCTPCQLFRRAMPCLAPQHACLLLQCVALALLLCAPAMAIVWQIGMVLHPGLGRCQRWSVAARAWLSCGRHAGCRIPPLPAGV